ncbi:GntR family transcriptional regulator [Tsukamurella soli]|uniref:GntR family transcriptional regulator n=1 Tax=Tsukamurella soli TaxID=644556 RepID=A0ABP8J5U9_9ACTN
MTLVEDAVAVLGRLAEELADRGASKLPPERDLAARLEVSRATVRRAIALLETEGVVHRVVGRAGGAYLTRTGRGATPTGFEETVGRRLARDINTVLGVPEMLSAQGFTGHTRVVSAAAVAAEPAVARALELPRGAAVTSLLRVRYADGDTLSLERAYLRLDERLLRQDLSGSLYVTLRRRFGMQVAATDELIELTTATESTGRLLGQPVDTPLLRLERVGYSETGAPIEYSIDLFRADRTRLRARSGTAGVGR